MLRRKALSVGVTTEGRVAVSLRSMTRVFGHAELSTIICGERPELSAKLANAVRLTGNNPEEYRDVGGFAFSPAVIQWMREALVTIKPECDAAEKALADAVAERAEIRAATIEPLLAKMRKDAQRIRDNIPAGDVEVEVKKEGSLDGDPILSYTADGVALNWRDVTTHGVAAATMPGARCAFEQVIICSISRERLDAAKKDRQDEADKAARARAARAKELDMDVPESAVRAYKACRGNPERLPDDIDNPDYWLVDKWSDAIEHQGLA